MTQEWLKELTRKINEAVSWSWNARTKGIERNLDQAYFLGVNDTLRVGDEVIETEDCAGHGFKGVVVKSTVADCLAVTWDWPDGKMTTSVTHGTRRI